MSFVKLQDGRSVYALDSLRLRNQQETAQAPQANTFELYMREGILYQLDENGIESRVVDTNIPDRSISNIKLVLSSVTSAEIANNTITISNLATAITESLVPKGSLSAFAGTVAPTGWLLCHGQSLSQNEYASLYTVIGMAYGNGSTGTVYGTPGGSRFNVPDLRGRFLRGVDSGIARDPDRASRVAMLPGGNSGDAVGSIQSDEFKNHQHLFGGDDQIGVAGGYTGVSGFSYDATSTTNWPPNAQNYRTKNDTSNSGGTETRPINIYVNYIIKL